MRYMIAGPDEESGGDLMRILDGDTEMTFQGYCATLRAAEALILKEPPDLAFIWLGSASLNGVRLAVALREQNPRTKIIFIGSQKENAVEAFEYEADGFLLTPLSKKKIVQVLQEYIR